MKVERLSLYAVGGITASAERRTLGGTVVTYGELGHTSIGPLRTKAGALRWGEGTAVAGVLDRNKLTLEHDRGTVRGHLAEVDDNPNRLYARYKVSDGELGDAALREAQDKTRDAFSFDVVNATVENGWLIDGEWIATGQVGIPAYANSRIDSVAANRKVQSKMTDEQRARLTELRAKQTLTQEEAAELSTLAALEEQASQDNPPADAPSTDGQPNAPPAPTAGMTFNISLPPGSVQTGQPVAASMPVVPGGAHRPPVTTQHAGQSALDKMIAEVCAALRPGGGGHQSISAALTDVTNAGAGANIDQPAWSGELWSGVDHEQEFVPLLSHGDLTNFEGQGWRFVTKPEMAPYAGNKAAIPSGAVTTEPSSWTASRQAVGHDLDRKFYDFPNEAFLKAYVQAVAQSWSINIDKLTELYIIAQATDSTLTADSFLSAVGKAIRAVKRAKMGRATFVMVSDGDMETLMEVTNNTMPAFLDLFNISPASFVSSEELADGTVIAGNRLSHKLLELPGSPIRASAQHIANGGIDEGFFAYYAFEEQAPAGIQSVTWATV